MGSKRAAAGWAQASAGLAGPDLAIQLTNGRAGPARVKNSIDRTRLDRALKSRPVLTSRLVEINYLNCMKYSVILLEHFWLMRLYVFVWSQKRKATSSKSQSRHHRGTSTERAVTWQQEAESVLQMIVDSPDSVPFRSAVNIEEFPVCNKQTPASVVFIARQYTDTRYYNKSLRPSLRYVPVSDENGLTYRHSFFHYTVAQSFCFYQRQTSSQNSNGVTPSGGAKYRWGIKIFPDFLPISRYISQTMQDIAIVTMEGE